MDDESRPLLEIKVAGFGFFCGCTPSKAVPMICAVPREVSTKFGDDLSPKMEMSPPVHMSSERRTQIDTAPSVQETSEEKTQRRHKGRSRRLSQQLTVDQVGINTGKSEIDRIKKLCSEIKILEAGRTLEEFDSNMATALKEVKLANQVELERNFDKLSELLKTDPILVKLRSVHHRFEVQLEPQGVLAQATREAAGKWIEGEVTCPELGDNFKMKTEMRMAEGDEVDKDGATTQIICKITLPQWPQDIKDWLCLERETDLMTLEFFSSAKEFSGETGGNEQLNSSMFHVVVRPALLPFNFEISNMREFTRIEEGDVPGLSAGIVEIEDSLPSDKSEFEGWKIPEKKWGSTAVTGTTIKHATPNKDDPKLTTITIMSKFGIPLPSWTVPLSLLMKVNQSILPKTFKKYKENAMERWEEVGYTDRITKSPDLYGAL